MEQLGSYLKTQRELRQIDIHDVSAVTKIGVIWLQIIEEDKWDDLPGKTFARGYTKAYATALGLDIDDVMSRYDNMYSGMDMIEVGDNIVKLTKKRTSRLKRFIPIIIVAVAIATVLVIWLV